MSSSDNPQLEPQPPTNVEPLPPGGELIHVNDAGSVVPATATGPSGAETPAWNGWDVLLLAALTFVSMIVAPSLVATIANRFWFANESWRDTVQQPIVVIISQFLLYIPVALMMVALIEGKYHVPFWKAIRWNWPRTSWKFLTIGAVLLIVLSVAQNLFPMPKDTPFEHLFDRPRDAYLVWVIAVTLGPLLEELFFRGLFYPVLARRWGAAWAVFLTALPFALLHLQQYSYAWVAFLAIFFVGIVCGVARAMTKSVAASFLVHVGYNGTQMLIAVLWTRGFTHMPKALATLCQR